MLSNSHFNNRLEVRDLYASTPPVPTSAMQAAAPDRKSAMNDSKLFFICHIYPLFTRKQVVSLYFGRDVRTRLGVAISEESGPSVFHIKAEAFR